MLSHATRLNFCMSADTTAQYVSRLVQVIQLIARVAREWLFLSIQDDAIRLGINISFDLQYNRILYTSLIAQK